MEYPCNIQEYILAKCKILFIFLPRYFFLNAPRTELQLETIAWAIPYTTLYKNH